MKIAFIIPKLSNQAPVIVVKDLVTQIKDKVELIDVFYFDTGKEIDIDTNCYKISFFEKINFDKYDIIHSHMLRPDLYIWYHRKKIIKAKCVSTLHNNIYNVLKDTHNSLIALLVEKLWIKALKSMNSVVVLSESMKNQCYNLIKGVPLQTIYNGRNIQEKEIAEIDKDDKLRISLMKNQYKLIGVSAFLRKIKGFSQLIKVLPLLQDFALVFVGDGEEKEKLITLAGKLNVSDRCLFIGSRLAGWRYLKYFDYYAMTSYSEGFPLSLLEAGQNKLPVFCSDLPIFRELFTENEVSFFELDNITSLKNAILLLDKNKGYFSNNLNTKVNLNYSVQQMGNSNLELYKKMIFNKT